MDILKKIIENPLFFKWLYRSDQETDKYWEEYIQNYPEEAIQIQRLKSHLKSLTHSKEKLSESEKDILSRQIKQRLANENKQNNQKKIVFSLLRYAAVAIIFFSVGGIFVYFQMKNQQPDIYAQDFSFPNNASTPTLTFSEGEKVLLQNSESVLDYTQSGQIILNEDSIIKPKTDKKRILINSLIIPYGNRSKVILCDGTTVWLNAGSRLIYPSDFIEDTREVMLFGEAFFNVKENKEKPFIVKTSALEVKVLGTEFNLSAYPDEDIIQTVLKKGSVAIRRNGANFFEGDIILEPNQLASFNKHTSESKIYNVDAEYYSIWTSGLLSFDEVDLSRIIKKVERFYNIKIEYENPLIGSTKISGKLDLNQDMTEVFEYLSKVSLTKFEKINNFKYTIK